MNECREEAGAADAFIELELSVCSCLAHTGSGLAHSPPCPLICLPAWPILLIPFVSDSIAVEVDQAISGGVAMIQENKRPKLDIRDHSIS